MYMKRDTEDMKLWLFDLAHGNMPDDAVVKGFIRHYVLNGLTIGNVQQDIIFHTPYTDENCRRAMESLRRALAEYADGEETRTLREVQSIVDAVRAGQQVQIAYYDPEEDDDPYVHKACW